MKTFLCFVPIIVTLLCALAPDFFGVHGFGWPWHIAMLLIFGITGSAMAFFVHRTAVAVASGILILASYFMPFFHLEATSLLLLSQTNPIFFCIPVIGCAVLATAFMVHTNKAPPKLRALYLLPAATFLFAMILYPIRFFSWEVMVIILFFIVMAICTNAGYIRFLRNFSAPIDSVEPTEFSRSVIFFAFLATLAHVMLLISERFPLHVAILSIALLIILLFFAGAAGSVAIDYVRYLWKPVASFVSVLTLKWAANTLKNALNATLTALLLSFLFITGILTFIVLHVNYVGEFAYVNFVSSWTPPEPLGLENWIDHAADGFAGGTGTEEDPYLIATPGQLAYLAKRVNAGANWDWRTYFKLSSDIDLAGKEWTPIGTRRRPFFGVLDGGDAVIYNLTIASSKNFQGLVGYVRGENFRGGVLRNLTLVNVDVKGRNFVGGLVGAGRVFISNSSVVGGTVKGRNAVGGLAGHGGSGIISSYYSGNVKGHAYVGGLAGRFGRPFPGFMLGISGVGVAPLPIPLEVSSATGVVSGVKYVGGINGFDGIRTNISHNFFAGKVKGEVFYAAINNTRHSSFSRGRGNFAFLHEMTGTEFHDGRNTILGRKDDDWYLNGILQLPTSEAENAFLQDVISSNYLTESMLDRLPPSFRVLNIPHRVKIPLDAPLSVDLGEEGYRTIHRFSGLFFVIRGTFLEAHAWDDRPEIQIPVSLPRGVYIVPCFRSVDGSYEVIWVLLNVI